jgi:hypothetical protein
MAGMLLRRQYSLQFLLVEVLLLSAAFGLIRQGIIWGGGRGELCIVAALFVIGSALGGLFGRFATGFALTFVGIFVGALFLPA